MDKLRVEGMLNIKDFGPDQIANRPVKVMAQVGPNRVEEFQGKVVFIDPELIKGGKYRVLAEVVNRRAEGDGPWLLRPGMQPEEMVIDALPGKPSGTASQPRTTPGGAKRLRVIVPPSSVCRSEVRCIRRVIPLANSIRVF